MCHLVSVSVTFRPVLVCVFPGDPLEHRIGHYRLVPVTPDTHTHTHIYEADGTHNT